MSNPFNPHRSAILAEIRQTALEHEADARAEHIADDPEGATEALCGALRELSQQMGWYEQVGYSWHPEGYGGARDYLSCWAPEASAALEAADDEVLDEAWRGGEEETGVLAGGRGGRLPRRLRRDAPTAARARVTGPPRARARAPGAPGSFRGGPAAVTLTERSGFDWTGDFCAR
jgi:hypothetical protein